MDKSYHLTAVVVVASAIAAMAFSMQASANPFARLGGQPLAGYGPPTDNGNEVRPDLRRRLVDYRGNQLPGTIIIDTPNTYLYFVLPGGKAIRYGIGVRPSGLHLVGRKESPAQGDVAGLDTTARDDRAITVSTPFHGRRRRQSSRCARPVPQRVYVPHPWH